MGLGHVYAGEEEEFRESTHRNCSGEVLGPGNVRWKVLRGGRRRMSSEAAKPHHAPAVVCLLNRLTTLYCTVTANSSSIWNFFLTEMAENFSFDLCICKTNKKKNFFFRCDARREGTVHADLLLNSSLCSTYSIPIIGIIIPDISLLISQRVQLGLHCVNPSCRFDAHTTTTDVEQYKMSPHPTHLHLITKCLISTTT